MFEIGNSLREARVRQQIELGEAELSTKIRARYLRALEEESFDALPAQVRPIRPAWAVLPIARTGLRG